MSNRSPKHILRHLCDAGLLILVLIGVTFRFSGIDWNQGTNLHPDEYGLTNTLFQLKVPASIGDYFNTRLSTLSPYPRYDLDGNPTQDGPDNRLRWGQWPIILLRWLAEVTNNTGYDEIRLMGRYASAAADCLTLLLLFLIGRRLFSWRTGLLATALSALAVMQIQQSHFMTVDSFAVLFTMVAMYAAVRCAQATNGWGCYIVFGVASGMALAARINLLPLTGMILIAALISRPIPQTKQSLTRRVSQLFLCMLLSALVAVLTFRVTHPMAFRATSGDTTFFTLDLNPDWTVSMQVAQNESNGIGGGPPAEQWANRPAIIFPLTNMILWGMGLPLGLMAWIGVLCAAGDVIRRLLARKTGWQVHILPLIWVGGYFLFMGTRWVKSMRYFLPIYPFLCLFAAWALLRLWQHARTRSQPVTAPGVDGSHPGAWRGRVRYSVPAVLTVIVLLGSLAWANAFVQAVYNSEHTRLRASRWIYQQIPAPFHITLNSTGGTLHEPIPAPDRLLVGGDTRYIQSFSVSASGTLSSVTVPKATSLAGTEGLLRIQITLDADGQSAIAETTLRVLPRGQDQRIFPTSGAFQPTPIEKDHTYYLIASALDGASIQVERTVVANENWDEGLPVPIDGYDPFGQFYRGITMEVRWYDDENKRAMFLQNLSQVDYIILPSQRAIWSVARLPLTYPMTMAYYRALFDGRLGFERIGVFTAPLELGPFMVSDVGGTLSWQSLPALPLFNYNPLAAEEAFSVYDHPPVWIFRKRPDFNLDTATRILGDIDLSRVIIQSPREATPAYSQ